VLGLFFNSSEYHSAYKLLWRILSSNPSAKDAVDSVVAARNSRKIFGIYCNIPQALHDMHRIVAINALLFSSKNMRILSYQSSRIGKINFTARYIKKEFIEINSVRSPMQFHISLASYSKKIMSAKSLHFDMLEFSIISGRGLRNIRYHHRPFAIMIEQICVWATSSPLAFAPGTTLALVASAGWPCREKTEGPRAIRPRAIPPACRPCRRPAPCHGLWPAIRPNARSPAAPDNGCGLP